nr:MAG TPA: hypothetical protein [Caudoviricetes sp.]
MGNWYSVSGTVYKTRDDVSMTSCYRRILVFADNEQEAMNKARYTTQNVVKENFVPYYAKLLDTNERYAVSNPIQYIKG